MGVCEARFAQTPYHRGETETNFGANRQHSRIFSVSEWQMPFHITIISTL